MERLDQVFEIIGKAARGKTCPAIDGIIEEGEEIMKEAETDTVRDAGMLAAAQAVEHYEITRYGTLKSWAVKLGMTDAAKLLDATLKEEKATDLKLTDLAESEINVEAEAEDDEPVRKTAARGRRWRYQPMALLEVVTFSANNVSGGPMPVRPDRFVDQDCSATTVARMRSE